LISETCQLPIWPCQGRYPQSSGWLSTRVAWKVKLSALRKSIYFVLLTPTFFLNLSTSANLYHVSVGENRDDRYLVISIYADGFDHLPNIEKPLKFSVHRYKPWYCRSMTLDMGVESTVSDVQQEMAVQARAEQLARQSIQKLIDQPGCCLRDGIDSMDFRIWANKDLSGVEPPAVWDSSMRKSEWTLVDTPSKMRACISELSQSPPLALAFDVESYNKSKYTQLTCLLQLSTDHGMAYVIDPLAPGVFEEVGGLAPIFADPDIVKVGHSIGGLDVRSLHRDFGIFVINAFDTYEAAKVLCLESHGLAAVCEHYGMKYTDLYKSLKNEYQTCDWRARPLTGPMIQYGRFDVHFLIELRMLMIRDLTKTYLFEIKPAEELHESRMVADTLAAINSMAIVKMEEQGIGPPSSNAAESTCHGLASDDFIEPLNLESDRKNDNWLVKGNHFQPQVDDETSFPPTWSNRPRTASTESSSSSDERKSSLSEISNASAAVLRLQASLMKVLSWSQLRCKDLWSDRKEPFLKQKDFLSLLQRARRNEVHFGDSQIALYEELVAWRDRVATRLECLSGFVAPLELLVVISWQRPTCEESLRRITYYLPDVLAEHAGLVQEMLFSVRRSLQGDGFDPEASKVYWYAGQNKPPSRISKVELSPVKWKIMASAAVAFAASVALGIIASRKRKR
jgi:ribonuclease D